MKRGTRILLFLGLLIVILIAVALLLTGIIPSPLSPAAAPSATPSTTISIVTVGQSIGRGSEIEAASLSSMEIPLEIWNEKMVTKQDEVVGKYALFNLPQGLPVMQEMLTDRPDAGTGSPWAKVIQPGQVAISIPISRLNSVAYGIWDGDHVNVIATTMFVDLDSPYQSILPNNFGQVVNVGAQPDAAVLLTLGMNNGSGAGSRTTGRAELDPVLNQAVYLIPSEAQRPRIVSQTILQDIQVLHIGNFSSSAKPAQAQAAAATPDPNQAGAAATPVPPVAGPDVITLIVSPQDAVTLTYLMYGGAKLTLTLRAPDDTSRAEIEAATLQFLLSQYAIPIPAKLPYGFQPRIDTLIEPVLQRDIPTPRP